MKVIILSKSSYKEKDCIYNAISRDECFSFMAKGAQDPKSKFIWLNNPMTVAEVEFLQDGRYKHKVINNAVLLSSPMMANNSYEYLSTIGVLLELAKNALSDEEKHLLFDDIESALNALRKQKDHLMVLLVFMAHLIKIGGAALEVGKCVSCGNKSDIVAFSFDEGGFLCSKCISEETVTDLSKTQLHLIRYIFMAKDYSLPEIEKYSSEDKKKILIKLKEFIDDIMGIKLNSINGLL